MPARPMEQDRVVSVVVPGHNVAPYLKRCLASLSAQTYKNIEIIVVDDGSTDNTASVLEELALSELRLRLVSLSRNQGALGARAAGIKASSGEFIGFVDGDDWVEPEMYEHLVAAALKADADIAICGMYKAPEDGPPVVKVSFRRDEIVANEIFDKFCRFEFGTASLCNKLYRRNLIVEFGASREHRTISSFEDYLVNIGCFAAAKRVAVVRDVSYYYRARTGSASQGDAPGAGFVRLLRGFETCLAAYPDAGDDFVSSVGRLFGHQLGFECYQVRDLGELRAHRHEIAAVLRQLGTTRPEAIYSLIQARRQGTAAGSSFGRAIRKLVRLTKEFPGVPRLLDQPRTADKPEVPN